MVSLPATLPVCPGLTVSNVAVLVPYPAWAQQSGSPPASIVSRPGLVTLAELALGGTTTAGCTGPPMTWATVLTTVFSVADCVPSQSTNWVKSSGGDGKRITGVFANVMEREDDPSTAVGLGVRHGGLEVGEGPGRVNLVQSLELVGVGGGECSPSNRIRCTRRPTGCRRGCARCCSRMPRRAHRSMRWSTRTGRRSPSREIPTRAGCRGRGRSGVSPRRSTGS